MAEISCNSVLNSMISLSAHPTSWTTANLNTNRRPATTTTFATRNGRISLQSVFNKCGKCGGKGAIECPGCKGTGKNKKNGNIFERWKCFDCQGFGLKSCPECGKGGGLTPEQRGER